MVERFKIREFAPTDYPAMATIHDALYPEYPFFKERVESEDLCFGRTRYMMKRFVAETRSGRVVGFGEYKHLFFSYHPRKFGIGIEVHPSCQRQGVGGVLYDRLMEELARVKAEMMWPVVLSTSASAIEFLKERGFAEKRRMFESSLKVKELGAHRFAELPGLLQEHGITISDFSSEVRRDKRAGQKLLDLEDSGAADVPGALTESPMDFHDYEIIILRSPIMIWEGSFIAKDGNAYVGESSILKTALPEVVEQGFTVVRPGYRGRKIALALKSQVALYAKEAGANYVITHNDSENAPMLAVNKKIGFIKRAEWITFESAFGS